MMKLKSYTMTIQIKSSQVSGLKISTGAQRWRKINYRHRLCLSVTICKSVIENPSQINKVCCSEGPAAVVAVQAAVIPKVSPQVAVAGVVVGSLLTPSVREPSWLGHHSGSAGAVVSWMERCSPSAWRRWPPSPVGDPRRAGGGGQTQWPTPPRGHRRHREVGRTPPPMLELETEESTLPPLGGAAVPCTFVGGAAVRQSYFCSWLLPSGRKWRN